MEAHRDSRTVNAIHRSSAPPPGSLWFLRDAIPLVVIETFDIGRIDSGISKALKEKLFKLGGAAAWIDAVHRSRLALDDLLTVPVADVVRRQAGQPNLAGESGFYRRCGALDILCQGELVGSWPFDVEVIWKILQRQDRETLLSLAVDVRHDGRSVIDAPRIEGWVRFGG